MSKFDKMLWRIIIWTLGLYTPILASSRPRSFVLGDQFLEKADSLAHLARQGLYFFFLVLAMLAFMRCRGKVPNQAGTRSFFLLTILLAAMPLISSIISGGTLQWTMFGVIGIYSATYLLPTPPFEWLVRELRVMLLIVFIYGSLVAAVVFPDWALNKGYAIEEGSLAVIPMRLFGTANHANALAPLAVFAWLLGRFPGCRLKGEYLHGAAILLVVFLAQSKTTWAIALALIGVYLLIRIASLGGFRKYLTYFAVGSGVFGFVVYLVKYSQYADRIQDTLHDPNVFTLTGRLQIWLYAIEMWRKHPLIGQGLDAWSSKVALANVSILGWSAPHAHNQALQILSESGLLGIGVMAMWAFYYFKIVRRAPARLRIPLWWLSAFFFLPGFTEVVFQYKLGPGNTLMTWIIFTLVLIAGKSYPGLCEQKEPQ